MVRGALRSRVQLAHAGTRWHTPHPPPRHAALPGGSQVVLRCGRRAWQEGPLTEGSGPSASSGALEPSLMEDPRPPRRSPRTAGGLWGSGESGSPLPCVPPASCSGLALEAAGAPGASWTGSQDFCPALGCHPAFPPALPLLISPSLASFLPGFPFNVLTDGCHCDPSCQVVCSRLPTFSVKTGLDHRLPHRGRLDSFAASSSPGSLCPCLVKSRCLLLLLLLLSRVSRVRLYVTPQTAAHQAPPSLGFSRQEHWSGLPFPSPMHESEK